jgi:starch-binding outer membrane protein, SusD/RagB family
MSETLIGTSARVFRSGRGARAALMGAACLFAAAACTDTAVPYFDAPTSLPNTAGGIQNAVTGLFSGTRIDVEWYVYFAGSYGRDIMWFLGASPNVVYDVAGLKPFSVLTNTIASAEAWDNEYAQIKAANDILATLPQVTTYTKPQVEAIWGIVQTVKAINFLIVAETRDTLGVPLYSMDGNPTDPPYCNQDVWKYIVALLDSANDSLDVAGSVSLPVQVPPGFASVGLTAGPGTVPGAFAAFNRALAGKSNLELAYAIARSSPGTHPTPASPGSPNVSALTTGALELDSSALYDPAAITPPNAGPFSLDAHGVYHTFSGQSGDIANPFVGSYYLYDALWDLQYDVDTLNDLRWINKFVPDPLPVQLSEYAGASDGKNFLPYKTVVGPIPIVRAEELALVMAQIQLGLGNYANAISLINQVHMQAGGFATPLSIASTYTAVRDSLLKEQRISTVFESSGDRMIALRMYGMEAVSDTTWQATSGPDAVDAKALGDVDYHQTISPVPFQEITARGGTWSPTCP